MGDGGGTGVVRVLFQNLNAGDRRKFNAESNDTDSGGGARDLRFRPDTEFLPFFGRLFSGRRNEVRTRNGASQTIEIFHGPVWWDDPAKGTAEHHGVMEVWPATDARPRECRIAKVHVFGFDGLVEEDPKGRRSVFMLIQDADRKVRVWFTTETSLRDDDWHPVVKEFALHWMKKNKKSGFLDLEVNEKFPNG